MGHGGNKTKATDHHASPSRKMWYCLRDGPRPEIRSIRRERSRTMTSALFEVWVRVIALDSATVAIGAVCGRDAFVFCASTPVVRFSCQRLRRFSPSQPSQSPSPHPSPHTRVSSTPSYPSPRPHHGISPQNTLIQSVRTLAVACVYLPGCLLTPRHSNLQPYLISIHHT